MQDGRGEGAGRVQRGQCRNESATWICHLCLTMSDLYDAVTHCSYNCTMYMHFQSHITRAWQWLLHNAVRHAQGSDPFTMQSCILSRSSPAQVLPDQLQQHWHFTALLLGGGGSMHHAADHTQCCSAAEQTAQSGNCSLGFTAALAWLRAWRFITAEKSPQRYSSSTAAAQHQHSGSTAQQQHT